MFPQVAPKFFKQRPLGPKNLGKDPSAAPAQAAKPATVAIATPAVDRPRDYTITVNGERYEVNVVAGTTKIAGQPQKIAISPVATSGDPVPAELAGTVLRLLKEPGQIVAKDETILVIEAMKMETEVAAPRAGALVSYAVAEGDNVQVGDILAVIA